MNPKNRFSKIYPVTTVTTYDLSTVQQIRVETWKSYTLIESLILENIYVEISKLASSCFPWGAIMSSNVTTVTIWIDPDYMWWLHEESWWLMMSTRLHVDDSLHDNV